MHFEQKKTQSEAVSDYYCFYLDCHLNRPFLIQDHQIGRANGLSQKVSSASRATEYFEVQEELPWDNSKAMAMDPAGVEMEEKPKTTSSSRRSSGSTTAAVSSIALDSTNGYFFHPRTQKLLPPPIKRFIFETPFEGPHQPCETDQVPFPCHFFY